MPMRKKLIQDGGFNKLKKDDLDQLQGESHFFSENIYILMYS